MDEQRIGVELHLMAIGAHAGDMEITVGAAILRHTRQGHRATLVHLTLGARGHLTLSDEIYSRQKRQEALAVAERLGADVRFLPYEDGELFPSEEAKWLVADLIRELRPTHVITHWPGSIHKDHTAAYEIVKDAIYYAAVPAFRRQHPAHEILGPYLTENWEDNIGYLPQIYLDVTPVFEEWVKAVRGYELFAGGVSSFDYLGYYRALAALRGTAAGYAQAVTFAADHPLTAYLSAGFGQLLRLFTSTSPIFRPHLKRDTVG
jgi:LmbE family N-acetylglucosaminyl deacetylase